jgi:hypothetical protein
VSKLVAFDSEFYRDKGEKEAMLAKLQEENGEDAIFA